MDIKDIKAIIDLMKKNSITEFELERQDSKIRLKRGSNGGAPIVQYDEPMVAAGAVPVLPSVAVVPTPAGVPPVPATGEVEVKSPMIGTFYRAPSPEAGSYVEIGTEINPESVVCIIEAMKVMNEIKAEVKGVITQVLVENAKPVEFGQPLFKVRPA
ncbi:MAG: acetyl-CoA carboxylase biotin carboxyl carrier protein [Verrucomicrobiota bacterium]